MNKSVNSEQRFRTSRIALFIVLLALIAIELVLLWTMFTYHIPSFQLFKHLNAKELESREAITQFGYDPRYREDFLTKLYKKGIPQVVDHSIEEAEAVRKALLNLGQPLKDRLSGDPDELLEGISSNARLLCSDLAELYGYTLYALGFRVRLMHISRSIFDPWDRHATVEIWDKTRAKWIVTDPTFNVSFLKDGQYLSLVELYDSVHFPEMIAISKKPAGKPSYASNIDNYYINLLSLLDNIYYVSHHHLPGISRYPPFRLFDPRRTVGVVSTTQHPVRSGELYIQNAMVMFFFGLGPIAICMIGITLIRDSAVFSDLRHVHCRQTRGTR